MRVINADTLINKIYKADQNGYINDMDDIFGIIDDCCEINAIPSAWLEDYTATEGGKEEWEFIQQLIKEWKDEC